MVASETKKLLKKTKKHVYAHRRRSTVTTVLQKLKSSKQTIYFHLTVKSCVKQSIWDEDLVLALS